MKRGLIRPLFCDLLVRLGVRLLVRQLVRLRFTYARKALYLLVFYWFFAGSLGGSCVGSLYGSFGVHSPYFYVLRQLPGAAPGNFHKSRKPAQILGFPGLRGSQLGWIQTAGQGQ